MQPKDWLKKFLDNRQLSKSHGQPLYRYQMREEEFDTLQLTLKTSARLFGVTNVTKISGWNAAFVIYAAEWWRRYYDGGKWSWERIFTSLNAKEPKQGQLYISVELGLGYWQRKVKRIGYRSNFIGTIVTEGGLPLKQLDKNDNWLSRLFKHAIPKYLRLQASDINSAIVIISDYADAIHLPKSYRSDETYAVLGDMVCLVAKLKRDHQLTNKNDPIDYLNREVPDWREQFPLPINNQAGIALLTDMIKTAAVKVETFTTPFYGRRILSADGAVQLLFELAAFVDLEKIVSEDRIADFPFRVDVEIVSDEGKTYSVGVALKTIQSDKDVLKMPRCLLSPIQGEEATQGYKLRFKWLSENIAEQRLIEAIDNSVPWTFIEDNEEWLLVGTASIRTRAKQVRILYAKELTCSPNSVTELATLTDKKLIEANGLIELRDSDNCFHIQTAQAEASQRYDLQNKPNKPFEFSSKPKAVYLGLPDLYCFDTETEIRKKINRPLLARPTNSKAPWQPLSAKHQGVYELRLQDAQGNIEFRKKCALLPENFAVQLHPSTQHITIENSGLANISCPLGTVNGQSIEFNKTDNPPIFVNVTLDWQGMNDTLTLTLPFPVRGGQLIDSNGYKLSKAQVNNLHGVRLRLLSENHNNKRHLMLEFKLKDDLLDTHDLHIDYDVVKTGAVIDTPIIDYQQQIQELLAISQNPNSYVGVTVYEQGTPIITTKVVRNVQLASEQATEKTRSVSAIDEIKTLAEALTITDDKLRQLFIRHSLKQLCIDFTAYDWKTLRESQNDAPLVENEIWTIASLESRVLIALVLQLETAFMQRFTDELPIFWELIPIKDWLVVFTRYKNYLAQIMDEADVKEFLIRAINKISDISKSLEIVTQLLKYHLFDIADNGLFFMKTDTALQWLISELKKEQQQLITRHPDVNKWLNSLSNELNQYRQEPALELLLDNLCYNRDGCEINKMRLPVTLLPLVLAQFCLTTVPSKWQTSIYLFKLKRLKVFDEDWFTNVFCLVLTYLSQQFNYQQQLQQETDKMMNADEDDLIPEIEQRLQDLSLLNEAQEQVDSSVQEAQAIQKQVPISFKNNGELKQLRLDNSELKQSHEQLTNRFAALDTKHNNLVGKIKDALDKRDNVIRKLLTDVKTLNQALQEIRQQLDLPTEL
jgi:hypothetical protein